MVRRPPAERKKLTPDLEAFARGESKSPRGRERKEPRIFDPRAVYLVPGVANRHARIVYDASHEAIKVALEQHAAGDSSALSEALVDALQLKVWRGRSFTSFAAFAEDALGLSEDEALKIAGASERVSEAYSEMVTALVFRMRAAALESDTKATIALSNDGTRIMIDVSIQELPQLMGAAGRLLGPMAPTPYFEDEKQGEAAAPRSESGDENRSDAHEGRRDFSDRGERPAFQRSESRERPSFGGGRGTGSGERAPWKSRDDGGAPPTKRSWAKTSEGGGERAPWKSRDDGGGPPKRSWGAKPAGGGERSGGGGFGRDRDGGGAPKRAWGGKPAGGGERGGSSWGAKSSGGERGGGGFSRGGPPKRSR